MRLISAILFFILGTFPVNALLVTPNTTVRVNYDLSAIPESGGGTGNFNDLRYAFTFGGDSLFKMDESFAIFAFDHAGIAIGSTTLKQSFPFDITNVSSGFPVSTDDPVGYLFITSIDATFDLTGVAVGLGGENRYLDYGPYVAPVAAVFFPAVVPEPSTWTTLLLGFACLSLLASRRRRQLMSAQAVAE